MVLMEVECPKIAPSGAICGLALQCRLDAWEAGAEAGGGGFTPGFSEKERERSYFLIFDTA